ncbi:MAG TPA: transposase [Candidatus Acidoferrales bacterium]|nr:transposase [Candidatus Acidoferrales bacterium]
MTTIAHARIIARLIRLSTNPLAFYTGREPQRVQFTSRGAAIVFSPAGSLPAEGRQSGLPGKSYPFNVLFGFEVPEGRLTCYRLAHARLLRRSPCPLRLQHQKSREKHPRRPVDLQPRLWSFMAGIARQNRIPPITIGGFDDHAHALIALPATIPLAKAVQLIKAGSSKWCNQNFADGRFDWQAGYSAVSVSTSLLRATSAYIRKQREHHRKRDFASEWRNFLRKNGFSPDES